MRITTYNRNVEVEREGKPAVIAALLKQFSSLSGVTEDDILYKEETRAAAQKKGIDWWILPLGGEKPTLVDAKVRIGSHKYWSHADEQDVMIEWSQSGGWGWANNPDYLTDWIIWVFPDAPQGYSTSIMVPHALLSALFPRDEQVIRRYTRTHGGKMKQGFNSQTLSHTICCTRDQLESGAQALGWQGPVWLTTQS